MSGLLERIESQIMYRTYHHVTEKLGYKSEHIILMLDGMMLYRPSNKNRMIIPEDLDNIYNYLKETINVSATIKCTRTVGVEQRLIEGKCTWEDLSGAPNVIDKAVPKSRKRLLEDDDEDDEHFKSAGVLPIFNGE